MTADRSADSLATVAVAAILEGDFKRSWTSTLRFSKHGMCPSTRIDITISVLDFQTANQPLEK